MRLSLYSLFKRYFLGHLCSSAQVLFYPMTWFSPALTGCHHVDRAPYVYVRHEQRERQIRARGGESGAWRRVRKIKVHSEHWTARLRLSLECQSHADPTKTSVHDFRRIPNNLLYRISDFLSTLQLLSRLASYYRSTT